MVRKIAYISMLLSIACTKVDDTQNDVSIASLRNIETNNRSVLISESVTLEGTITASSKYGEFYNMLIVEDESAAVKIMCEVEDLYQTYPFGNQVKINCSGLYMTNDYGALTLGAEPTDDYTLDYISQSKFGQYITQSEAPTQTHQPLKITIGELTPLHTYRYIELSEIIISNDSEITTFCERDIETGRTIDTEHTITDKSGNCITLTVDRLCSYADAQIPTDYCTIQAIVGYYNQEYSVTITNCSYSF